MEHSYYQKHVFICTNQREYKKACGNDNSGENARHYMKKRIKQLGLEEKIRINSSGCLGRCAEGPVCVIYPDATWYYFENDQDLEEIIHHHLMANHIVDRLKI